METVKKNNTATYVVGFVIISLVILISIVLKSQKNNQSAQEAMKRSACKDNLKSLALAVHSYHDQYHVLPIANGTIPGDEFPHSWRVTLLGQLGDEYASNVHQQYNFDEAWDGQNNRNLHNVEMSIYRCPADSSDSESSTSFETNYVAVTGKETIFPSDETLRFRDITDGISQTLMYVEDSNSGIHWIEPRDIEFENMSLEVNHPTKPSISSHHLYGAQVLFVDGSVRFMSESVDETVVRALLTRSGSELEASKF